MGKKTNETVEDILIRIESKIDLFLAQQKATQRAIAHLKADFPEMVKDTLQSTLNKRAIQGYSRINS